MHGVLVLTCVLVASVRGHDVYLGKCPQFNPKSDFDWSKFSSSVWYVTNKFDTRTTCLTYQFLEDETGQRTVQQVRQVPIAAKVGIDREYKYVGKLSVPNSNEPGIMSVKFPLNAIGSASYVITDTDYDTYAMVCTCQDVDLFLSYAHRLSCSMLQKDPIENAAITAKLRDLVDPKYQHDFDKIKQEGCEYGTKEVFDLDPSTVDIKGQVSDVVGSLGSNVESSLATVEDLANRVREKL